MMQESVVRWAEPESECYVSAWVEGALVLLQYAPGSYGDVRAEPCLLDCAGGFGRGKGIDED